MNSRNPSAGLDGDQGIRVDSRPSDLDAVVERVTRRIAPLWPLEAFVAVNPFVGLADRSFEEVARRMAETAGARMTMDRSFYREAILSGRIESRHLDEALRASGGDSYAAPRSAEALREEVLSGKAGPSFPVVPTVASVVARTTGHDWPRLAVERLSAWAAGYLGSAQASWKSPWRDHPAFAAWRAEASIDRSPEVMGASGFRSAVRRLPPKASDAIAFALERLRVPEDLLECYLHRLLMVLGGWASFARQRVWDAELHGGSSDLLKELLAVHLGFEAALLDCFGDSGIEADWAESLESFAMRDFAPARRALAVDVALQNAFESAWQERLVSSIGSQGRHDAPERAERPAVQAVFCIDVRSERFRRHLELIDPGVETIGFAGFFGFPIEYVPVGMNEGGARCPVLLAPAATIAETAGDAASTADVGRRRMDNRRVRNAWKAFKQGAVSCFAFVGPVGLAYVRHLVTDSLGWTRPVPSPRADGIPAEGRRVLGPTLDAVDLSGRANGLSPEARLAMAESALRGMSLTRGFARVVLLAGHGSTTANNPHATGLDCGACGGHDGEANARVAAAVLNDRAVRAGLRERGIAVPDDTIFLAGLHDTVTDEVAIRDRDSVPGSHAPDIARLESLLSDAARATRGERAASLGVSPGPRMHDAICGRASDWAQVRPEWGLAGCAAFVAAPRHRTAGLDLGGRAFLHSYAWRQDEGFKVLELVMTAPMVVASWISLQYYASTVDNRVFGCGNKTLHNVVGGIGVFEGNGGDLRSGLPLQSLHDGKNWVHEPLRLNVVIEAPIEAMNDVIARHDHVRSLLDNGWIHLWALDETGRISSRYSGELDWTPVAAPIAVPMHAHVGAQQDRDPRQELAA